jgi:hypothetical protein
MSVWWGALLIHFAIIDIIVLWGAVHLKFKSPPVVIIFFFSSEL